MSSDYLKRVEVITTVVVILLIVGMFNIVSRPNHNVYLFDENTGVLTVNGDFDMSRILMYDDVRKLVFTDKCEFPTDCSWLFYNMNDTLHDLESIDLSAADFSHVENMSYMFCRCWNVENIILTGIDISNVTDMSGMFQNCYDLKYVDLIGVDTSNVTDMSCMFSCCTDLVDIDLSELDLSSATNMSFMFYYCISLYWVDISFDIPNLQEAHLMFDLCDSVKYIYVMPELRSMIDDTRLPNFTYVIVV